MPNQRMHSTSASERRRATRALPSSVEPTSLGCLVTACGYLVVSLWLYRWTGELIWLAIAAPGVLVAGAAALSALRGFMLLVETRRVLEPRGVRCLVVYSDSPVWQDHIRSTWLPRLGQHAVTLNWSERASWPPSLEARLFKYYLGSSGHNFNPAVIVFRGLRRPRLYRFFYAFHEAKHGRTQYLSALESELFGTLGV